MGSSVQTLAPVSGAGTPITTARWASSYDLRIAISAFGQGRLVLTDGDDFKPSWSQSGSLITFFHTMQYGATFDGWKTKLCVSGADGSNPRILSNGQYADFNPSWTRDGTNQIIFNRYAARGSTSNDIYLMPPQGAVGDEVLVSTPSNGYEWAFLGATRWADLYGPRDMGSFGREPAVVSVDAACWRVAGVRADHASHNAAMAQADCVAQRDEDHVHAR